MVWFGKRPGHQVARVGVRPGRMAELGRGVRNIWHMMMLDLVSLVWRVGNVSCIIGGSSKRPYEGIAKGRCPRFWVKFDGPTVVLGSGLLAPVTICDGSTRPTGPHHCTQ